jgi:hypothetical protein
MSSKLSVAEILANLEKRLASHRRQEALHAQQVAFHQEQQALHAAEGEKVARSLEAFRAAAGTAVELAAPPPNPPPDEPGLGPKPRVSRLVDLVVKHRPADQPFGAKSVADEVNRRYAAKMKKPVSPRTVGVVLARLHDAGTLRRVQEGRAHHEALYARGPRR